jgi:hypothetical protein
LGQIILASPFTLAYSFRLANEAAASTRRFTRRAKPDFAHPTIQYLCMRTIAIHANIFGLVGPSCENHAVFQLPDTPKDAVPRESIEVRALVVIE